MLGGYDAMTFSALSVLIKTKFHKGTKDCVESSVGDFEETRCGKWLKIQNLLERIWQYGREYQLEESDLQLIMTPAVEDFIDKLHIRMTKRNVEASDPNKTLKADLDTALSMLEDNLNAVLAMKESAHRRAVEEAAMKKKLDEVREQRLHQEKKEAADRLHQEKKEAADRELALQIAQLQYQHKQCCTIM